jgi:hypothetical protein
VAGDETHETYEASRRFVGKVMAALGVDDARGLALNIGLTGEDDRQRIEDWVSGRAEPDYHGTMKLLAVYVERGGSEDEVIEVPSDPTAETLHRIFLRERRLEDGLADLADAVTSVHARISELRGLVEEADRHTAEARDAFFTALKTIRHRLERIERHLPPG